MGEESPRARGLRVGVHTDYAYRRVDGRIYGERAFVLFLAELAGSVEHLEVVGRLDPRPGPARYPLPLSGSVGFVALPHYPSLARPVQAGVAMLRSLRRLWRALDEVDAVWLLGPHPLGLVFAALAAARRRGICLGVRQDLPAYVRSRHPGRLSMRLAAIGLEAAWRTLGRIMPVVAVGPDLARRYRRGGTVVEILVSLVHESDLVSDQISDQRSYTGDLHLLTVGRLDQEKNPLLLAEILAALQQQDSRWYLTICGEGPLEQALVQRLRDLGVDHRAQLCGYIPLDRGLQALYRRSHAFLHVSWTEGMPQVLLEAFAAGLPVVATDVGGVADVASGSALLVPPGSADAVVARLRQLADDPELRATLVRAGLSVARRHTVEAEIQRLLGLFESMLPAAHAR